MPEAAVSPTTPQAPSPLPRPVPVHDDADARGVQLGIVLGAPRSGTTFLMRTLTAVPGAECVTGTLLPVAIPHVVNQRLEPETYEALAVGFERALDAYLHSGRCRSRAAAVQKWFNAPTGVRDLYRACRGQRTIRQLIYKEPFLSLAPDFVLHALPEARLVHIYRDGRDVANSLVRSYDVLSDERLTHLRGSEMRLGRRFDHRYVPWWVEEGRDAEFLRATPYVRAIWMWAYMVRRCREAFATPAAAGRVLLLRYEDLMHDPPPHGVRVLDHFGLEPGPAFQRRLRQAHRTSIGSYRRRAPAEVAEAERVAGAELSHYGYL